MALAKAAAPTTAAFREPPQAPIASELFISSGTLTGAFGGVAQAHNGLAHKLSQTQVQLDSLGGQQTRISAEVRQFTSKLQDLRSEQDKRIVRMGQQITDAEKAQQNALTTVNESHESLEKRLMALETSLEELADKHANLHTAALSKASGVEAAAVQTASELLISSGALSGAFGGVEEAHNGLAHKLSQTQAEQSALSTMSESLQKRVLALETSLEDFDKHANLHTVALSKVRSDLTVDLDLLKTRVSVAGEQLAAAESRFQAAGQTQAAELTSMVSSLGQTLDGELKALRGRLLAAEQVAGASSTATTDALHRLEAADKEVSGRLESQVQRLEALLVRETATALERVRVEEGQRLAQLEAVVKQSDFERLGFAERVGRDFEAFRKELRTSCAESEKAIAASAEAEWSKLREEVAKRAFCTQLEELTVRLATATKNSCETLANAEARWEAGSVALRAELGEQVKMLQSQTSEKCAEVKRQVQEEEEKKLHDKLSVTTGRIDKIDELSKVEFARTATETAALRKELELLQDTSERKLEASSVAFLARLEVVQSALQELAHRLNDLRSHYEDRDVEFGRLQQVVHDVMVRAWPWKNNSAQMANFERCGGGYRNRSMPPSASVSRTNRPQVTASGSETPDIGVSTLSGTVGPAAQLLGGVPAVSPTSTVMRKPHAPLTARPGSATQRRQPAASGAGELTAMTSEEQELGASIETTLAPETPAAVGNAMAAARWTRNHRPQPTQK
eukprot:TRINITY_DN7307_c0_g1_i2.p1 TRINITY_DN7307_c0_g1~~TRINITY_DN7307_c0_g1_i2.p1  ORF type:complete len:843 (-),score=225.16 TRINITY_DN7307_c0_g1_i2:236-2458(-)